MIGKLSELIELAKSKPRRKLVVAAANDQAVLEAIGDAYLKEIIQPILVGKASEIAILATKLGIDVSTFEIRNAENQEEASNIAVSLVKSREAQIIMKGFVPTSVFLRAIIDKRHGIEHQAVMNHLALMEIPYYHKLLAVTDVAMNIAPTLEEKAVIIQNSVKVLHALGLALPNVAILCPVEAVNPKIESTLHAEKLVKMNVQNQLENCIIEGPYSFDNAISASSAAHKGIKSSGAGNADLLLCPNLDAGNILYKSLIFMAGAQSAAIVTGAEVPIVLTSRSDSKLSKLYSIALACCI